MAELSRFIQFNNEQINAQLMLHYERLAQALADAPYLSLIERQLIELNLQNQQLAISVFWRHRDKETMQLGRLSDIYILTLGFWRYFNVDDWFTLQQELKEHPFEKLFKQLVLLVEEFRLMDVVIKMRPGTNKAFSIRRRVYIDFHKHRLEVNSQKGFVADALVNYLFLAAHEGMIKLPQNHMTERFENILYLFQQIYQVQSTKDSINLIHQIMPYLEEYITKDLVLNYYALIDSISESSNFQEHKGVKNHKYSNQLDKKETIEQLFRTWHRETKDENGVNLRYELERGNEGKTLSLEAEEGQEGNAVSEEGIGNSNASTSYTKTSNNPLKKLPKSQQFAGNDFGEENVHVVFQEKRIEQRKDYQSLQTIASWRAAQAKSVKALTSEFRKRIVQKEISKRQHLSKGRLDSTKLANFLLEDRPKLFYQKNAPAKPLDAVFGLLIDGSASMIDKMEGTKKAVLLFHDVLRQMDIPHEIVSFYEDAYEATPDFQPNIFEWLHKFEDRKQDCGSSIMALSAHEDNRDGFAIRWMTKRLKTRDEKHRFLLIFSDGEPSAFQYAQNGVKDTAEAVLEAEKQHIQVLHLFLNTEKPEEEQFQLFKMIYGTHSVVADSVEKFTEITIRLLRRMIIHVIQS